ncbi:hypothetical protein NUK36_21455, partial [Aeromonas hydrophila]|nr:hypothetical protein [Aeromonas hydrophila]
WGRYRIRGHRTASQEDGRDRLDVDLDVDGELRTLTGTGNGPIDAFLAALQPLVGTVVVRDYVEHALSAGGDARAAAYVECEVEGRVLWGVAIHEN